MDVSGVSASTASMYANMPARTEASVAVQKKAMEIQEQTAAKLIASIEQSAPKPNATGPVGGNIDITV